MSDAFFVENIGQFDNKIDFMAQTEFGSVGIGSGKVYYNIRSGPDRGYVLVYDTGTGCIPNGMGPIPGVTNYLRGNISDHKIGAMHFASIVYPDIWDRIDLSYIIKDGGLKYELYLHPGADPSDIRFTVEGGGSIFAGMDRLLIPLGEGRFFTDSNLRTFSSNGEIACRFAKIDSTSFGFDLGTDRIVSETVIDPEVTMSIPLGGADNDELNDVTIGSDGNIYLVGSSESDDFPVTPGAYDTTLMHGSFYHEDIVVTCLDPTGSTIVFSTFIGHTGTDKAKSVLLTESGEIVVGGTTSSTYFPTTPDAYQKTYAEPNHCFLLKLPSDGSSLIFSTYLGGGSSEYFEGLTMDGDGNFIIYGQTYSDDFPTTMGVIDRVLDGYSAGYVSILSPDGSDLIASTFFSDGNYVYLKGLELLSDGSLALIGHTSQEDFPATSGAYQTAYAGGWYDGFMANIPITLDSVTAFTYFGGSSHDESCALAVDEFDNLYGVFRTNSTITYTPGTVGGKVGKEDIVLVRIGMDLVDATITYVGGTREDSVRDVLIDGDGNVLMVGTTESDDFPMTGDAFDPTYEGTEWSTDSDSFFCVVDGMFSEIVFSTYIGGPDDDDSMCLSFGDTLYIGGITHSSSLPFTSNPHSAVFNEYSNMFLMEVLGFQPTGGSMSEPTALYSLKGYSDKTYEDESGIFDHGESVYLEATGADGNVSAKDGLRVNVSFDDASIRERTVILRETDIHTGIYRGSFKVPWSVEFKENLTFYPRMMPSMRLKIVIDTPVRLDVIPSSVKIKEHDPLLINITNLGWWADPVWTFTTDSSWLIFDQENLTVSGIPTNPHVGKWHFTVNISNEAGRFDDHRTTVDVSNVPPNITTPDVLNAQDGFEYRVDYECDEDNETGIFWNLGTNATWLRIASQTGILNGTPTNDDLGSYWVNVVVDDGNKGTSKRSFTLVVANRNDRPIITTTDITTVNQNDYYIRKYDATDPDPGERFTWTLVSNADWLSMNETTGTLSGSPGPGDVSVFHLNITVTDKGGLSDHREFDLTVNNVNDPPYFIDRSPNTTVKSGRIFTYDFNASDPDPETTLTYSVSTVPASDLTIDPSTGEIAWDASLDIFDEPPYVLQVSVKVTDGALFAVYPFRIEIEGSTPPQTVLQGPPNGERASYLRTVLRWIGSDADGDKITYDVYISESQAYVMVQKSDVRIISGYAYEFFDAPDLQRGKTYYWTVIPHDGGVYGTCSGVWSFTINNPPEVADPGMVQAKVGSELKYRFTVNDPDLEDKTHLIYTLIEGPEGLVIGETTGTIRWTPRSNQAMLNKVSINVSDGIDYAIVTFTIDVQKEAGAGISALIIVVPIVLVLLVAGIVAFLLIRRRSSMKTEEANETEHISVKDEDKVPHAGVTDVPLTPTEAHAHLGKGSKAVSYEDLYGTPAPKGEEEALTTRELRDYIHGEVEGLEKLRLKETPEFEELEE